MKRLLLGLILVSCGIIVSCSNSNSRKFLGLKGNVEKFKDYQYTVYEKFGEITTDELDEIQTYTFNKEGLLTEVCINIEQANHIFIRRYFYENGKCVKLANEDETYTEQLIESNGKNQIWEIKNGEETIISECYKSNEYNCFTKKIGESTEKQEIWYDKKGNDIETKITKDSKTIFWSKSEFKNNNIAQRKILKDDYDEERIETYSYSDYDSIGNWTKSIIYHNGKAKYVINREITYFK